MLNLEYLSEQPLLVWLVFTKSLFFGYKNLLISYEVLSTRHSQLAPFDKTLHNIDYEKKKPQDHWATNMMRINNSKVTKI